MIELTGMAARMTRVSSHPWMKALMMLAKKMVMKKMNMPIFSPIPSCNLFKSLKINKIKLDCVVFAVRI